MKLDNINVEKLNTDKNMKVRRSPIVGFIRKFIAIGLAVASVGMLHQCSVEDDLGTFTPESEVVSNYTTPIGVGVEQVNDLNIIINGGNCSDSFISGIAEELVGDEKITDKEKTLSGFCCFRKGFPGGYSGSLS